LRPIVGRQNLQPGDEIELREASFAWVARLLVVSVVRATRTVSTKLVQPRYPITSFVGDLGDPQPGLQLAAKRAQVRDLEHARKLEQFDRWL
jgi:hypothetical protein